MKREEQIFEQVLAQTSPETIERALREACAGDADLRRRVEELLAAHQDAAKLEFLQATGHDSEAAATRPDTTPTEAPGSVIGRYKLLEKLGEGGFGVVYMAEQREPVKRRVALKIIKVGMDTREVVARFEAERQALAMMDHPSIAKIYDAGSTERPVEPGVPPGGSGSPRSGAREGSLPAPGGKMPPSTAGQTPAATLTAGRPYFVMELVRGIKLTDYCDERNLATPERLELFMQVCQAVQHAHQKGIIHRDLKPSNILVTVNDGQAVPKIIDFGIAKATQMELTEKTVFTRFQQFLGTPAYMSPEQAELSSVDIDTRSDIYSLGVLLYELLTGKTPFDARELLQAGLDEIRRTIREKEPERPSTRVSTLRGDELTTTAKRRGLDAPKLVHVLRGDLDWIVMKCLEKDRARRYETANGLAADIQRHLSNEPIVARPPSAAYRFQKLASRNKVAFAAGAAVLSTLIAGLGIAAWQFSEKSKAYHRALTAEAAATERAKEADAVSKFLTDVLKSPDPARDGHAITVAEILGRAAKKLETELVDHPGRKTKLQDTLGATYLSLGLYYDAIPLQEKVLQYRRATLGSEHIDTLYSMNMLALSYHKARRREEAISLEKTAVSLSEKVKGPGHPWTLLFKGNLASFYHEGGRQEEALPLLEELLALNRKLNGPGHPQTQFQMQNLALSYHNTGRREDEINLLEESLPLIRKRCNLEHPDTIQAMANLAVAYSESDAGRRRKAEEMREEVLTLSRKVNGTNHSSTRNAIANLADSYIDQGKYTKAEQLLEQSLEVARKSGSNTVSHVDAFLSKLGDLRYRQHQYTSAELCYRELLEIRRQRFPLDDDQVVNASASLGRLFADWAWAERTNGATYAHEAEKILRHCLDLRLERTNATPWKTSEWKSRLANALVSVVAADTQLTSAARESTLAAAESLLLQADGGVLQSPAAERLEKYDVFERFIRLYEAWERPTQAAAWRVNRERFAAADAEVKSASTREAPQ